MHLLAGCWTRAQTINEKKEKKIKREVATREKETRLENRNRRNAKDAIDPPSADEATAVRLFPYLYMYADDIYRAGTIFFRKHNFFFFPFIYLNKDYIYIYLSFWHRIHGQSAGQSLPLTL